MTTASDPPMPQDPRTVVVLGTGGTIAGTAASATDTVGYRSAELGVDALLRAVPALAGLPLQAEQVAQVDSKDMDYSVWRRLAEAIAGHLARPEVGGVVVTHGTDTLEETAYFLYRVLDLCELGKPVVLTAAMRPATSLQADGPQNLLDAVLLAREPGASGVLAVLAGHVYAPPALFKTDSYRLDAFSAGDAGLFGRMEDGRLRRFKDWPAAKALGIECLPVDAARWPRIEIVLNHVAADGRIVDALLAQGLDGLVLAGTGNGTLSQKLEAAALRAQRAGVRVLRSSRCAHGHVVGNEGGPLAHAGVLSPVQARIELLLRCLTAAAPQPPQPAP